MARFVNSAATSTSSRGRQVKKRKGSAQEASIPALIRSKKLLGAHGLNTARTPLGTKGIAIRSVYTSKALVTSSVALVTTSVALVSNSFLLLLVRHLLLVGFGCAPLRVGSFRLGTGVDGPSGT